MMRRVEKEVEKKRTGMCEDERRKKRTEQQNTTFFLFYWIDQFKQWAEFFSSEEKRLAISVPIQWMT